MKTIASLFFIGYCLFSLDLKADGAMNSCTETILHEFQIDNPFVIDAKSVSEILKSSGLSMTELLQKLVPIAQKYARPEISEYYVGAVVVGKSGTIYCGVNLEFRGAPLNQTVHAEQFAIANARNNGETELCAIAISAPPCGHCRQFMNELVEKNSLQILISDAPAQNLSTLLPQAFGPDNLGMEGGLMTAQCPDRAFTQEYSLLSEARFAAYNSYAPYSGSKTGIAIQTTEGKIYSGSYLENVGFNPSLSPLQSALVALVADGAEYSQISEALLIEQGSDKISQAEISRNLLKLIAPQASFEVQPWF
jgi:cytidine deaminase